MSSSGSPVRSPSEPPSTPPKFRERSISEISDLKLDPCDAAIECFQKLPQGISYWYGMLSKFQETFPDNFLLQLTPHEEQCFSNIFQKKIYGAMIEKGIPQSQDTSPIESVKKFKKHQSEKFFILFKCIYDLLDQKRLLNDKKKLPDFLESNMPNYLRYIKTAQTLRPQEFLPQILLWINTHKEALETVHSLDLPEELPDMFALPLPAEISLFPNLNNIHLPNGQTIFCPPSKSALNNYSSYRHVVCKPMIATLRTMIPSSTLSTIEDSISKKKHPPLPYEVVAKIIDNPEITFNTDLYDSIKSLYITYCRNRNLLLIYRETLKLFQKHSISIDQPPIIYPENLSDEEFLFTIENLTLEELEDLSQSVKFFLQTTLHIKKIKVLNLQNLSLLHHLPPELFTLFKLDELFLDNNDLLIPSGFPQKTIPKSLKLHITNNKFAHIRKNTLFSYPENFQRAYKEALASPSPP